MQSVYLGLCQVNQNSKIPAAIDKDGPDGRPIHLFESGAIMLYFADKVTCSISQQIHEPDR